MRSRKARLLSVYLLLVVIPVAGIGYIVWDHKRKAAAREALSAGRLQQMLGPVEPAHTEQDGGPIRAASEAPVEVTRDSVAYVRCDRVLDPSHTLVYYLLRTALPDYVVFAHVAFASVLAPSPGSSAQSRAAALARLHAHTVDFLVSDRNMQPIAVVQVTAAHANAATAGSPELSLDAVGVRYIELDPAALPRKDAVRAIVLGDDTADAHAQSYAASRAT